MPGYGFLSENTQFAAAVEDAGMVFVGPSPTTIEAFGLKHIARSLAVQAGVPVVPGTPGLVESEASAVEDARHIGFPVMLKATGGGGGMGLMVCNNEQDVSRHFRGVQSRGDALFKNPGVLIERYFPSSHHIEVQVFGNGAGQVVSIGERECSIQRRHQKVVEECPSPLVATRYPHLRAQLCECAVRLAQTVHYRSAGTVEFLVDHATGEFFFLEMNTRLQVEHGITELCYNIDLVELMYQQADAQLRGHGAFDQVQVRSLQERLRQPCGHAIEVRVYAENPVRNFAPSTGLLQQVDWYKLPGTRIDTWIRAGNTIGPEYDPLLAKVMQFSPSREEARLALRTVLTKTAIRGLTVNLDFLLAIVQDARFIAGDTPTSFLDSWEDKTAAIDVISGGSHTLIQDFPGRPSVGHGFGHAGPMDPIAFQVANVLVENPRGAEGLEITLAGPEMLFLSPAVIALCGPVVRATLDDGECPMWTRVEVHAGQRLRIGRIHTGCRAYLAIHGGLPGIAPWFGSKATSSSSRVGGYQGRALRAGDVLSITRPDGRRRSETLVSVPERVWPRYTHHWELQAIPGPYETGYLSRADIDMVYSQAWKVSHNAARGGIRLIGPAPQFARPDGGDGGSHPSNVIEYGYPIGGLNWTGSEAVLFPVDCPDFGGHLCNLTVITSDHWKIGQMRPGDSVQFRRVDLDLALQARKRNDEFIDQVATALQTGSWDQVVGFSRPRGSPVAHREGVDIVRRTPETGTRPRVTYRAGGDGSLLVDYGSGKADLNHKCRATALRRALERQTDVYGLQHRPGGCEGALLNIVSCGNSLMIHFDSLHLPRADLVRWLVQAEDELGAMHDAVIPNRTFRLPIVFSHPKLDAAMHRYMVNQRPEATYLPDTFQFVADNNGITRAELQDLFLHLEAVVIGVGFLMALPQCLPLDPRHRLNVPKMNPSRVSTPAGTVAWGGNAIAIYTHDSPGGYMPTGLTIPGLDIYGYRAGFSKERPWMFQDMDVITFYEVGVDEYDAKMAAFDAGTYRFEYVDSTFSLAGHNQVLVDTAEEVKCLEETRTIAQQHMAEQEGRLFGKWTAARTAQETDRRGTGHLTQGEHSRASLLLRRG